MEAGIDLNYLYYCERCHFGIKEEDFEIYYNKAYHRSCLPEEVRPVEDIIPTPRLLLETILEQYYKLANYYLERIGTPIIGLVWQEPYARVVEIHNEIADLLKMPHYD